MVFLSYLYHYGANILRRKLFSSHRIFFCFQDHCIYSNSGFYHKYVCAYTLIRTYKQVCIPKRTHLLHRSFCLLLILLLLLFYPKLNAAKDLRGFQVLNVKHILLFIFYFIKINVLLIIDLKYLSYELPSSFCFPYFFFGCFRDLQ